jgi:hypothetical protein
MSYDFTMHFQDGIKRTQNLEKHLRRKIQNGLLTVHTKTLLSWCSMFYLKILVLQI